MLQVFEFIDGRPLCGLLNFHADSPEPTGPYGCNQTMTRHHQNLMYCVYKGGADMYGTRIIPEARCRTSCHIDTCI